MDTEKIRSTTARSQERARSLYVTIAQPAADGVSLIDLWRALLDGKWLIATVCLLFGVVAAVYSMQVTPLYRAQAILAPANKGASVGASSALGGLAGIAGIALDPGNDRVETIALFESKGFTEQFIRDEKLLPVLFPEKWNAEAQSWTVQDPEEQPDIRDGVRYFNQTVRSVSEDDPKPGLITLSVEWRDPELAAQWAGKLVSRINETARRRDIDESQRKLDYLYEQLRSAHLVELRQAVSRVIEEQINAMMLAQAQDEYAFKVIDPPVVPKRRIWPKRTLIVLVAMFLGGFASALLILGRFAIRHMPAMQEHQDLAKS